MIIDSDLVLGYESGGLTVCHFRTIEGGYIFLT